MQEYSQGVPAFFYLTRIYSFAGRQHKTYSFPCVLCNPWIFLVAYGKKSLEEILFKILLRKKYNHHSGRQQIIIFNENLD